VNWPTEDRETNDHEPIIERQLRAEEQGLSRKLRVRVQANSDELKDIEQHTQDRGDHGRMILPEQRSRGAGKVAHFERMQYLRITPFRML
jgi:hypothetical protein